MHRKDYSVIPRKNPNFALMMRLFVFLVAAGVLLSCNHRMVSKNEIWVEDLRNGDLVFQASEDGAMTDAIHASTDRGTELSFSHVGIVQVEGKTVSVIEAVSQGVTKTSLEDFLAASAWVDGKPAVRFYRLWNHDESVANAAVERALGYIGRPYDYAYAPGDSALYCSELVYECYLEPDGSHIFTPLSMTFKDSSGEFPQFWLDLFERLGQPIPEGEPGTNPNAMSLDPVIAPLK